MSRYIDADALIEQLKSSSAYNDYEWAMYADGFIEDIENAPSIDIVRCNECENWQIDWVPEGCECVEDLHYCAVVDGCKFSDFFCADGERREP